METATLVCPNCHNHLKPYKGLMKSVQRKCNHRGCGMTWVVTFPDENDPNQDPSYASNHGA